MIFFAKLLRGFTLGGSISALLVAAVDTDPVAIANGLTLAWINLACYLVLHFYITGSRPHE